MFVYYLEYLGMQKEMALCFFILLILLRTTRVTNANKYSDAIIFCKMFEMWCFLSVRM